MKISIYTIEKKSQDVYSAAIDKQKKMIRKYAQIDEVPIFNKKISQAQHRDATIAKESYSEAFKPYLKGYCIALDPNGKMCDSFEFSKKLDINRALNFFIAGAYGFEASFLQQMDEVISLSPLTYSHQVAKLVLFEQCYRAMTILHHHPYHK